MNKRYNITYGKAEIKRKKLERSEVNFQKFNGKGYKKDIQKEIHSANMHTKCVQPHMCQTQFKATLKTILFTY